MELINTKESVWNCIAVSPFSEIFLLLDVSSQSSPFEKKSGIQEKLKFSNGKFYQVVKSAKNMGLIINGNGIKLTELGSKWLSYYKKNEELPNDLVRNACLNVKYFKEYYEKNPLTKDQRKILEDFRTKIKETNPKFKSALIGAMVRRYLKGIFDIEFDRYSSSDERNKEIETKLFNIPLISKKKEENLPVSKVKEIIEELSKEQMEKIILKLCSQK